MLKCYEHMGLKHTWAVEQTNSTRVNCSYSWKWAGRLAHFFDLVSRPGGYIKIKKFFEAGGHSN